MHAVWSGHAHPLFTCVTCQHSGRIWEIGGVSTDPAHRRKRYTVSRSVPAVRRSLKPNIFGVIRAGGD